jgi:hypothetical protein
MSSVGTRPALPAAHTAGYDSGPCPFGTDVPAAPEGTVSHDIANLDAFERFIETDLAGIDRANAARLFPRFLVIFRNRNSLASGALAQRPAATRRNRPRQRGLRKPARRGGSRSSRGAAAAGCCQAWWGLIAAMTMTTVVVIAVVTVSSGRPISVTARLRDQPVTDQARDGQPDAIANGLTKPGRAVEPMRRCGHGAGHHVSFRSASRAQGRAGGGRSWWWGRRCGRSRRRGHPRRGPPRAGWCRRRLPCARWRMPCRSRWWG